MSQVSSVGELGLSPRSDNRMYLNNSYVVEPDNMGLFSYEITNMFEEFSGSNERDVTRLAAKVIVSREAIPGLLDEAAVTSRVEALTPILDESGSPIEYLVFLGENHSIRQVDRPSKLELIRSVQYSRGLASDPEVDARKPGGLTSTVKSPSELMSLWGDTFGWTIDGCEEFADQLGQQEDIPPTDRSVWFKGLELDGELVACAMAERLDMPSTLGSVALVEHTEWATRPEQRGMGYGRLVVRSLTNDISSDLQGVHKLIYAECNILSGAHVVAVRSGFHVPETNFAGLETDQILFNNVRVGDGLELTDPYRSFLLLTTDNYGETA